MSFVDFHPGAATQTEGAVTGLRLFFSGIPILGTLIAMWVMRNYDLSEVKAREIKKELDIRRNSDKKQSSTNLTEKLSSIDDDDFQLNTVSVINLNSKSQTEIDH
jgi:GPH family glycoside/pentoside/hexuronide:cation symporter